MPLYAIQDHNGRNRSVRRVGEYGLRRVFYLNIEMAMVYWSRNYLFPLHLPRNWFLDVLLLCLRSPCSVLDNFVSLLISSQWEYDVRNSRFLAPGLKRIHPPCCQSPTCLLRLPNTPSHLTNRPPFTSAPPPPPGRLLKYTPDHLHCTAHFWGPLTPQGTGLLALQSVSAVTSAFRVAATGTVLDLDKSAQVVKKLKLVGTPQKVMKKTAFIQVR